MTEIRKRALFGVDKATDGDFRTQAWVAKEHKIPKWKETHAPKHQATGSLKQLCIIGLTYAILVRDFSSIMCTPIVILEAHLKA